MESTKMPAQTARPLKVGLFLPLDDRSIAAAMPRWSDLKAMAQHAEAVGFDSLWVPDHLLFPFSGPGERMHGGESWSILASLAAVTSRIELGTAVVCTSFRNPALLAKMADTVDEISEGRLI